MVKAKPSFSSVMAISGFRYLWINQFLSQLAYNTLNFALIIWVFKLTGSNFAVSILIFSVYLPSLLFGILGGVVADLADKKKILLIADFLYAISYFAFIFIRHSYPLIILNAFFLNSISQFFVPAESSSLPLVVPKDRLFFANSLFSLTLYTALLIGFASAGPILTHLGINAVFYTGFFVQMIGVLLALNLPSIKSKLASPESKRFLSEVNSAKHYLSLKTWRAFLSLTKEETKQTFSFIKGRVTLSACIILLAAMQGMIGILAVLVPAYLERVLRIHATDASYFMMMPLGLGMVLGAYLLGRFAHSLPRRTVVIPAIIMAGLIFLAIGIMPTIARSYEFSELSARTRHLRYFSKAPSVASWFGVGAFTLGLAAVSIIIPSQTTLQESTDEKVRGKILSVLVMLMNISSAIPVLLVGAFADLFGVEPIFILLGVVITITGIIALKPHRFFPEDLLPRRVKAFLGTGHWE